MANKSNEIIAEVKKVIVGKDDVIKKVLMAILSQGHVLLEDIPGVGKTTMALSFSRTLGLDYQRVQCTPDTTPSDIIGYSFYQKGSDELEYKPGVVMCNLLLADEINRTIPRTQASLLESMGEFQVTVDGKTDSLPKPFFVIATQNPIEMDGTFPLPEAQLDRFLMRIEVGYPSRDEEMTILERFQEDDPLENLSSVISLDDICSFQKKRASIIISPAVRAYIADIAAASRAHEKVRFGISPRGTLGMMRAAQGLAFLRGRDFVKPDDVKELARPVFLHRIILKSEERTRGVNTQDILSELMEKIPVPVSGS